MYTNKKIILLVLFIFSYCADTNDLYYSIAEANSKIIVAFAIKDAQCNFTHRLTAYIPGEARKTEVDACVQAIYTKLCGDWNVSNPTPFLCTSINYRTNFKIRGM
ncbi:MAG: hypothetical protein KBF93_27045 [Leptospiraceae bacterium]|nr:hypothetical protein [Leptospiraceae bacterium]